MSRIISKIVELEELSFSELEKSEKSLLEKAKETSGFAYAPYSRFRVGAVLELENGQFVYGNNQENAAYPSGLCAERVAVYYAGANYPQAVPKKIGIYACGEKGELDEPAMPCGACLQALWQYEKRFGKNLEILLLGKDKVFRARGVSTLLPFAFSSLEA